MAVRFSKRSLTLSVVLVVILDFWFYYASSTDYSPLIGLSPITSTNSTKDGNSTVQDTNLPQHPVSHYYESHLPERETLRREALSEIIEAIVAHAPNNLTALNHYRGHPPNQMYNGRPDPVFTQDYLNKFLKVDREHMLALADAHAGFVNTMHNTLNYDFEEERMQYKGDGIVYVGGLGSYNWLTLLSIRHVRHLGSKLPIEVILPLHKDAEEGYCELLATMDAKCVILEDFVDEHVKGFQLKGLALLVSSFERVLLLDADNIPAHTPDRLFEEGPFANDSGLVVWPDYWRRATHPVFYDIVNITLGTERVSFGENDKERDDEVIPVHDLEGGIPNPSSESGQLLLNKRTNWYTTLLSTYYNFYGPNYYYPLFSQGTLGQGDKETFLSAAVVVDETFYQVKRFVIPFGHFNRHGSFRGGAIGQFDPIQDESHQKDKENTKGPQVMFVHSNTPKLNPLSLRTASELVEEEKRKRLYGTGMRKSIGYDFEWQIWDHMRVLLCEVKVQMSTWNEIPVQELCEDVKAQCMHLEKSAKNNE
ncbi:CYFA0S16e02454g1_1 [Cyberlindnera fabianii]|uniref:CYFA0S16e02454g1_1 n=1 Tax=Cyberlindnera fabianii TaxID=36022 RepID=A0A061B6W9_CYBFA|nr:CYFA0S16e02454g1_1 [Cyberlindnera fabianii]